MFNLTDKGTAYEISGPDAAPVVILIHGLGLSRKLWSPYIPELAKYWRVLSYDLFGHGDSQPIPEKANLALYAKQISDLMDHLEIASAAIVGFSIGGMINRRFVMDFPDKTSVLAILNSPHNRGEDAQVSVEERAMKVREQGPFATLDEALKRWFTPSYLEDGEGVEKVRSWRNQVDAESYAQAAWVLANGVRELIAPSPPIEKPALIMTCENDSGSTPKMSMDIQDEISESELKIILHLKHLGLMENPQAFAEPIIDFLKRKYH